MTGGLGLESTKAQLDRGYIRVGSLRDRRAGVYAVGDVIASTKPHPQLAHVASAQGIQVAERLAGRHVYALHYDRIPPATYCQPALAVVGLTAQEAKKRRYDVGISGLPFASLAKPRILGHDGGFVKVVSEAKYDEVLGVHMIGPHATDLISEACLALRLEATTEEIARTIHPHPTLAEALMQAAEAVYATIDA